jgi:hypothetical protein
LYDDLIVLDREGVELDGDENALEVALLNAREMACAEVAEGRLVLDHRIDTVDEAGKRVGVVSFCNAVGLDAPKS